MKRVSLILAGILLLSATLAGCREKSTNNDISTVQQKEVNTTQTNSQTNSQNGQNDQQVQNQVPDVTKKITVDDFDFVYKGIHINDTTPYEDILNTDPLRDIDGWSGNNGNIDFKAQTTINSIDYQWNVTYLPSKENEDLIIEDVVCTGKNFDGFIKSKYYIVSAELLTVPTHRGIKVGDSLEKFQTAYGTLAKPEYINDATDCYIYKLNDNTEKELIIYVDNKTKKVTKIRINYNNNKAMDDMNIVSFD